MKFRRLAAKIDQHMQQLAAQGVSEAHTMLGVYKEANDDTSSR
jgi:hypothetical protein